ncbi:MAG: SusC/RagA family TonB-linked outer membrane protein [Bacteroidetes bacterium]|nr:SusC/RagA family TonB-linked outer membrane protein [Bacteroidota bacterium]
MRFALPLLIIYLALTSLTLTAQAQRTTLRGHVSEDNGKPLAGASLTVRSEKASALTKDDGSFSITVSDPQTAILVISHVGFATKEVAIKDQKELTISLVQTQDKLGDVTVISALGLTRKQKSVGYSSQTVNVDQLTEARDVNVTNTLAGKVAGLQVTTTGQPGSSSRIVIRGENSMTGNNQPLWVVDGVPINNDPGDAPGSYASNSNIDYGNGAADLNPDDIESITVLKGPNAAALYGSRAANGAILVTTKKGKAGDKNLGISINQNTLFNTITEFPAYQNEYGEGGNGGMITNGNQIVAGTGTVNMGINGTSWGMPMLGQPFNDFSGHPIPGGYSPQPNNVRQLYKTSISNTSNISISKGDALGAFRLSYTNTYSNDVMEKQNLIRKHNLSLTASHKFGSFITMDSWILYTNQRTNNRTPRNLDAASPMAAYVYMPRSTNVNYLTPWANSVGNSVTFGSINATENPLWAINENTNQDTHNRLIGGIRANVQILRPLSFRLQASGDMDFVSSYIYKELGGLKNPNGSYSNYNQNQSSWDYQAIVTYNGRIGDDFTLTANAGTELVNFNNGIRSASINALLVHNMPSISNSNAVPSVLEAAQKTQTQSLFANATLGFRDFLFLDLSARNDWSSTLPVNNCSFFYPSATGSFVFTNFLPRNSIISYGKLRASVAQVGNSAPFGALLNTYGGSVLFLGTPYITYTNRLTNPNLKPEQTVSTEAGLDLNLFHDRIVFTGTVYRSAATNQIITASTSPETGFTSRVINAGKMTNQGIELSLNAKVLKTKRFTWNLLANWSMNRNKVVSLVNGVDQLTLGTNLGVTVVAKKGYAYGTMLGNAPYMVGDTVLVNSSNGRTIVNPNVIVGNFHPDWIGSIGSEFRYAGFDLSILFTAKWHGQIYSASYGRANFAGVTQASLYGRDAWLFSTLVLGENGQEQMGNGQTVGSTVTPYADANRPKGAAYPNAYFPKTNPDGTFATDKNGHYIPGTKSNIWMNPTTYESDMVLNNVPAITFDATSIKLSQLIFGYTFPQQWFGRVPIHGLRVAFVGRNLWTLLKHTPQGIDPEAANNSGNAQGIEAGGSFPYATYGFDLKVNF